MMDMHQYKITVCSVNWYSCQLLINLFNNLTHKSKHFKQIKFLVIDNTNGKDKEIELLNTFSMPIEIIPYDPQETNASCAHAAALNYALSIIDTEFTLITDPDVYIFKENWDSYLVQLINNKQSYAVGTTFPEWQLGKFHNFPNAVFCLFKTKTFRDIEAAWTPYSKNLLVNLFQQLRRMLLRLGLFVNRTKYQKYPWVKRIFQNWEQIIGVCSNDTGYKIAKKAKKHNLPSITFDVYIPDKTFKMSHPESMVNLTEHFELYHFDKLPIVTHRYSTRSKVWQTSMGHDHNFWIKNIEQYEKILRSNSSEVKC